MRTEAAWVLAAVAPRLRVEAALVLAAVAPRLRAEAARVLAAGAPRLRAVATPCCRGSVRLWLHYAVAVQSDCGCAAFAADSLRSRICLRRFASQLNLPPQIRFAVEFEKGHKIKKD